MYQHYVTKYKKFEIEFLKSYLKIYPTSIYYLSTKEQDMYEHWDVKIDDIKYDVKALRKINRNNNSDVNEFFHWIEIRNVNNKDGWLYGGADKFAFETKDNWVIVDKIKLQQLINPLFLNIQYTNKPEPFKLYQRKNRKDVLILIETIDLVKISDEIIEK